MCVPRTRDGIVSGKLWVESGGRHLTPKHNFEHDVKLDVEARVRQGVKAVLEEVLKEEMSEHLKAGYRELTPTRKGERNGYYQRNLVTPAGTIERLEVPRDREGEFVTEVFERYKRMTGDVEEAILEMYLSGISVRKIAGVTEALSRVKVGKDAVSRIASRLQEEQRVDLTPVGGQTRVSDMNADEGSPHNAGSDTKLPAGIQTRGRPPCPLLAGQERRPDSQGAWRLGQLSA